MKKLLLLLCLAQAASAAVVLTVTAGNGQLVPANLGLSSKPIVINIKNSGVNVVGATVAITCTIGGSGTPAPLDTSAPVTDASGNATVKFLPGIQTSGQYIMQYTCTGTYSAVSASFFTTGYYLSPSLVPGVYFYRLLPSAAALNPYTATAGSAGTSVKVQVFRADTIAPVGNVAVRLLPINDGTAGTQQVITVAEGTGAENSVLTDANGYATLTPTFTSPQSAQSSSYETFKVDIGSFNSYGPFQTNILASNSSVLPGVPPAGAPNPGVGAHSKWRLNTTAVSTTSITSLLCIAEIAMYDASGAQIATTGGTASASSTYGTDYASRAFDGDTTTYWDSNTASPTWLRYDFPAAVNPAEFYVIRRNDLTCAPGVFTLQYSDDGASWTNATSTITETLRWDDSYTIYNQVGWGFAIASPTAGNYLSYRLNISANGGAGYLAIAEIGMATAIGGSTVAVTDGPQAYATSGNGSNSPRFAFDGSTGTYWQGTTSVEWISANFRTPKQIAQVTVTPVSGQLTAAPTAFTIEGSNDGGQTWTVLSTCAMTWGGATPQTCNVAPPAGPLPTSSGGGSPPSASQRGNIDFDQIASDARHGDGTKLQTSDVTGVFGHCAMYGTFGALTDSGVVCGGGTTAAASGVLSVGFTAPVADFTVTPSAPAQGNVNIGITKTLPWAQCAVAFSATPVFDFTLCGSAAITLTGNVTSSTAIGLTAGHYYTFLISQDATGSRTFAWPANVKGATTIGSTLSKANVQTFISDGVSLYAICAGVTNQ